MPEIIRNRAISPLTRKATSVNYRVHIDGITASDTLVVNIRHKTKPFNKSFRFKGSDVIKKKSLGFKVYDDEKKIEIIWISTQPING